MERDDEEEDQEQGTLKCDGCGTPIPETRTCSKCGTVVPIFNSFT